MLSFFSTRRRDTRAFGEEALAELAGHWSLERQMAVENVADRAKAYGIPGEIVDGNDVFAVWEATQRAIERARGLEGRAI